MKRRCLVLGTCIVAFHGVCGASGSAYYSDPLPALQKVSTASDPRAYRLDAARTIYEVYAPRVYKGRLPPLIHAVVVVETTVEGSGQPIDVRVVRGPSHAPDVTEAVLDMIRHVTMPAHANPSAFKFIEIWLVTKDGRFQLDSLTEGQN